MKNPNAKLTWTKVKQIRSNKTATCRTLAERFDVSVATISQVKRGATWPESKRPAKRKYVITRAQGRALLEKGGK